MKKTIAAGIAIMMTLAGTGQDAMAGEQAKGAQVIAHRDDGEIIDSGSIHAMENEATRRILSGQSEAAHISVFDFDGDKVVEKAPVLSLRRNNDNIIIANMLLPDNSENVRKNLTLIEIKDIVDEIMECDSLVDL